MGTAIGECLEKACSPHFIEMPLPKIGIYRIDMLCPATPVEL